MKAKLTSRKFIAVVAAAIAALCAAFAGELAWQEATRQVVALVLAYLGVEGAGDVAARWRGGV